MAKTRRQKQQRTKPPASFDDGEILHISDLKPDPENARLHNPRNVGMIADALREVGAARSGVIDENGQVLAGNATLEALAEAGIERVKVVDATGNEWVVVRRRGLTREQKQRLALYDNRTAELATWDLPVLKDLLESNPLIFEKMWSEDEFNELLEQPNFPPGTENEQGKLDEKKPVTCPQCGHVFQPE